MCEHFKARIKGDTSLLRTDPKQQTWTFTCTACNIAQGEEGTSGYFTADLDIFKQARLLEWWSSRVNVQHLLHRAATYYLALTPDFLYLPDAIGNPKRSGNRAPLDFSELLDKFALARDTARMKSISPFGARIPLVARQQAIERSWEFTVRHWQARFDPSLREAHYRLFAVGAPGIGKTRFGSVFDKELLAYGNSLADKTDDVKELLEHLQNVIYVRIDFANTRYDYGKHEYAYETTLQWRLVARAIYGALDTEVTFEVFAERLRDAIGEELPNWFTLPYLGEYLCTRSGQSKATVYWHWDEINDVVANSQSDAVQILKLLKQAFTSPSYFSLLLMSGTLYVTLEQAFERSAPANWSVESPPYVLPLGVLNSAEVQFLVEEIHSTTGKEWLTSSMINNRIFKRLLQDTGGVPRLIEMLLESIHRNPLLHQSSLSEAEVTALASVVTTRIADRYAIMNAKTPSFDKSALLALSNSSLPLNAETEELLANGFLQSTNTYSTGTRTIQPTIPFFYLRANPSLLSVEGLDHLVSRVTDASVQLTPSEFEELTVWHHIVTINSLCKLGETTVSLRDFFQTPFTYGYDIRIKLQPQIFGRSLFQWPNITGDLPALERLKLTEKGLFSYTILNAKGAPCDGFQFVIGEDGHTYLLAFQQKYTDGRTTQLTAKEIAAEVKKVGKKVKDWQTKRGIDFIQDTYLIVLSNRNFEPSLDNRLIETYKNAPPAMNIMVVKAQEHFGSLSVILPPVPPPQEIELPDLALLSTKELQSMPRTSLQRLAKHYNIKANDSSANIINKLIAKKSLLN